MPSMEIDSGVWHPQRLLINHPVVVPSTKQEYAAELFEIGSFRSGTTDPRSPNFDSTASWVASDQFLEIRIPYMSIGFADPSSLQAYRIAPDGSVNIEKVERVGIVVVLDGVLYETDGYT